MTTQIDSNTAATNNAADAVNASAAEASAANPAPERPAVNVPHADGFVTTNADVNGNGVSDKVENVVAYIRYFTKEVAPSVTLLIASFSPIVLAVVAFRTEIAGLFGA